jgi:hypothetical protein
MSSGFQWGLVHSRVRLTRLLCSHDRRVSCVRVCLRVQPVGGRVRGLTGAISGLTAKDLRRENRPREVRIHIQGRQVV